MWRLGNWAIDSSMENRTKYCQEVEELRRICCEETDRAGQAIIDELSVHQERNLTQNKVNSLSDAREFDDPETASISGATHVPSQPSTIQSPGTMRRNDSELLHDSRNVMETPGNFFERLSAREGQNTMLFNNSKSLATSSQELTPAITGTTKRPETEMRGETVEHVNPNTTLSKSRWIAKSDWWN